MIKYLDKSGNEITKRRWGQLIRLKHYGVVARDQLNKELDVYTSWVGVSVHGMDAPGMVPLYLTWVKRMGEGRQDTLFEQWTANEREARESHQIALEWATAKLAEEIAL